MFSFYFSARANTDSSIVLIYKESGYFVLNIAIKSMFDISHFQKETQLKYFIFKIAHLCTLQNPITLSSIFYINHVKYNTWKSSPMWYVLLSWKMKPNISSIRIIAIDKIFILSDFLPALNFICNQITLSAWKIALCMHFQFSILA